MKADDLITILTGKVDIANDRLHFLNFFNDPRIIREQRIAAYKGYRGGSGGCFEMKGRLWCKVEAYEGGFGCSGGRGCCGRKRGDVASFETKRRSKLLGKLLRDI
ncbi:hypothetical protein Tco_0719387 [Tanacetum coccineum]